VGGQENLLSIFTVEWLYFSQDGPQPVICIQGIHGPAQSWWLCLEKFYQLLIHAQKTGPWMVDGIGYGFQQ
jgi:hypothetical protein